MNTIHLDLSKLSNRARKDVLARASKSMEISSDSSNRCKFKVRSVSDRRREAHVKNATP